MLANRAQLDGDARQAVAMVTGAIDKCRSRVLLYISELEVELFDLHEKIDKLQVPFSTHETPCRRTELDGTVPR